MKKLLPLVLALAVSPAFADNSNTKQFYAGIKSGSLEMDLDPLESSTPVGIVVGYQPSSFGVELEVNAADIDYNVYGISGEAKYKSIALYGVYRTEGDVYFKAKAGVLREELDTSVADADETGLSVGVGAGVRMGAFSFEAEYTMLEENIDLISLGANVHF